MPRRSVPLPLTRAGALERWRGGLVVTLAAEAMVVATAGARHASSSIVDPGWADAALFWAAGVVTLPLLLLWATTFAERTLLTRPPKRLLAFQAGLFLIGSALATAILARELDGIDSSALIPLAGALLTASLAPVGAWFAAALLTIPND